jgi:hypothetical protein
MGIRCKHFVHIVYFAYVETQLLIVNNRNFVTLGYKKVLLYFQRNNEFINVVL